MVTLWKFKNFTMLSLFSFCKISSPLNPGNCYDTALNFLPLTHGVLHIEALRITDLVSNKSVDVRSLPDIIAELRPANDSVMEE